MWDRRFWGAFIGSMLALLGGMAASLAAEDPAQGDVRDLRIGMSVSELPKSGYREFACGNNGGQVGQSLAGWEEFQTCPAGPDGLHEVAFQFDDSQDQWADVNSKWEGTKLAGHPVVLSLLIDETGLVKGVRAVTDPAAPRFLRRQAYLLGVQVMGRYGRDGWTCTETPPGQGRAPIGKVYVDRHCEKVTLGRHVLLDVAFYRAGETDKDITNAARVEILQANAG